MVAKKSASSQQWLARQQQDPFVKKAQKEGFRSRASFKLQAIQARYGIIKKNDVVIDLGAAPGGWCQAIQPHLGKSGVLIACDLLPMAPLANTLFLQGDFTSTTMQAQIHSHLPKAADVIVSDMAPNLSGIRLADQWAAIALNESVLAFCQDHLAANGNLVMKCFQGEGFDDLSQTLKRQFTKMHWHKPEASRQASKEVFAIGLGFK